MNTQAFAASVVRAAARRKDSPVPWDFIIDAIQRAEYGSFKIPRNVFTGRPTKKAVYNLAQQLFREAQIKQEESRIVIEPKIGNGIGAMLNIVRDSNGSLLCTLYFDEDDTWVITNKTPDSSAHNLCEVARTYIQNKFPFG